MAKACPSEVLCIYIYICKHPQMKSKIPIFFLYFWKRIRKKKRRRLIAITDQLHIFTSPVSDLDKLCKLFRRFKVCE